MVFKICSALVNIWIGKLKCFYCSVIDSFWQWCKYHHKNGLNGCFSRKIIWQQKLTNIFRLWTTLKSHSYFLFIWLTYLDVLQRVGVRIHIAKIIRHFMTGSYKFYNDQLFCCSKSQTWTKRHIIYRLSYYFKWIKSVILYSNSLQHCMTTQKLQLLGALIWTIYI